MHLDVETVQRQLLDLIGDVQLSSGDRADALIFEVVEKGLDLRPVIRRLLEQADTGQKLKDKLAAMEGHALMMERFVGLVDKPRLYAQVTRATASSYCPPRRSKSTASSPATPSSSIRRPSRSLAAMATLTSRGTWWRWKLGPRGSPDASSSATTSSRNWRDSITPWSTIRGPAAQECGSSTTRSATSCSARRYEIGRQGVAGPLGPAGRSAARRRRRYQARRR